jgi:hypothetical protein
METKNFKIVYIGAVAKAKLKLQIYLQREPLKQNYNLHNPLQRRGIKAKQKKNDKILCKGAAKRNKFKNLYKGEGESDKKRRNPLQNSLGKC